MTDPDRSSAPPTSHSLQFKEFDGYRLLELLGEGAMGQVWRALDLTLDRHVAIKMIRNVNAGERERERFRLEALALGRIQHANVVAVYRCGEVLGQPYIVYELVAGQSLDSLVGSLGWQDVLTLGIDLARGLAAAHNASVLHRDIKPGNVMRTRDGIGKLIDFGVARLRNTPATDQTIHEGMAPENASTEQQANMTARGDLLGTPRYLAPELVNGATASAASDVYALGLILWETLAGTAPYGDRPSLLELFDAIMYEPLRRIASLRPDLPFEFAAIIDRAVSKNPEARFASADAFANALDNVQSTLRSFGVLPELLTLTPQEQQAELVRGMFKRALSRAGFAERFYARLFDNHPEMRSMFPSDLAHQGSKLVNALTASVASLRDPRGLQVMLEDLGARHVFYGVREAHIDYFGESLRAELDISEGGRMDDEHAQAWSCAWAELGGAVRRGITGKSD